MTDRVDETQPTPAVGAAEIDVIVECERTIRAAQAERAHLIVTLFEKRLAAPRDPRRLDEGDIAKSVIAEVAMARQVSASASANQFGFALGLKRMPLVQALLARGEISERVAKAVVSETVGLSAGDTSTIDSALAPKLATLTAKQAAAAARKIAIGLDPHGAQRAAKVARSEHHISMHMLPHSMAAIRMNLPAEQAVAVYKALDDYAQGLKYEGDRRSGSQIMVDTAVERITGQSHAGDVAVEVGVLMTAESLLGDSDMPALLSGYGPLPAAIGRRLAAGSKVWLRRLFTDPISGDLIGRDPRRRRFDGPLAHFIDARDQQCQRPWCDCRIRDHDHIDPYDGSNTTAANGQGLCKRSHTTKHLPGWQVKTGIDETIWVTPTGHHYTARRRKFADHGPTMCIPKVLDNESPMEYRLSQIIGNSIMRRRQ